MSDRMPTEKPVSSKNKQQPQASDRDVRAALSDVVEIINSQVALLKTAARAGKLDFEGSRLLNSYARALCTIANEERHQAMLATSDLGAVSDDDLETMAREAQEVLRKRG